MTLLCFLIMGFSPVIEAQEVVKALSKKLEMYQQYHSPENIFLRRIEAHIDTYNRMNTPYYKEKPKLYHLLQEQLLQTVKVFLQKREDVRKHINDQTYISMLGGSRVQFSYSQKGGKETRYIASPEGVLRIIQDLDEDALIKWLALYGEIIETEGQLSQCELEHEFTGSCAHANSFLKSIMPQIDLFSTKQSFHIDHNFVHQSQYSLLAQLRKQSSALYRACTRLKMLDEKTGQKVLEVRDPLELEKYLQTFFDTDGNKLLCRKYIKDKKLYEIEYYPLTEGRKSMTYFYHESLYPSCRYEYSPKGIRSREIMYRSADGSVVKTTDYNAFGFTQKADYFLPGGEKIKTVGAETVMYDDHGHPFATLGYENRRRMAQGKRPISSRIFLRFLAQRLQSPEKLSCYFGTYMNYTSDWFNPVYTSIEYFQVADQTIRLVRNDVMLGDCDDYAFLARDILRQQGKKAYVIGIPGHALCMWLEKRPDGRYDAWTLGTFGLDCNGFRYSIEKIFAKDKSHASIEKAINAVFKKYKFSGLGLAAGVNYTVKNGLIEVLDVPSIGHRESRHLPVSIFEDARIYHLPESKPFAAEFRKKVRVIVDNALEYYKDFF